MDAAGNILSFACVAKDLLSWICDHLQNLKEANKIVKRIFGFMEYMQNELKKIEMYNEVNTKTDTDSADGDEKVRTEGGAEAYLQGFLDHLKSVKTSLESSESERNKKGAMNQTRKFLKGRATINDLLAIEDELKLAMDKLQLFISVMTLKVTCESRDSADHNTHLLNELSDDMKALQASLQENDAGIEYPIATKLSAPCGLTIREGKNKFILSWKPCSEEIDKYELCYDEAKNRACFIDSTKSSVEIGAPKVKPSESLLYTMKMRGICGGVKGEWSNTVVGQFTKPLPQKPTIKKLCLRSTLAEVTVTTPAKICLTESPITCWQMAYIIDTSTQWSCEEFTVEKDENDQTFHIHNLEPERRYTFKVQAMNAEGWSDFSNEISGDTIKLPPKLAKPLPPLIEALSSTRVKVTVESPEGANFMAPVTLWQVTVSYFDHSTCKQVIQNNVSTPNYAKEYSSFNVVDLAPKQLYSFKVIAKNERSWSPPSDTVIASTCAPPPPKIRASSFKTTYLVKIRWELSNGYTKPSYYEISKRTKGNKGKELEVQHKIPGDKLSVTFTNLNNNTTYCFKLRSWNGCYVSEWSEEIKIKTDHVSMLKRLSPRPRSPLPPRAAANYNASDYNTTLAAVKTARTTKAAELSDQSDDEDPVII